MLELQKFYPVVALLLFAVNADSFDKYKVVETTNGKIRGTLNTTFLNGIPFYSFKGIPYAKPPIGVLRFRVSTNVWYMFLAFANLNCLLMKIFFFLADFGRFQKQNTHDRPHSPQILGNQPHLMRIDLEIFAYKVNHPF